MTPVTYRKHKMAGGRALLDVVVVAVAGAVLFAAWYVTQVDPGLKHAAGEDSKNKNKKKRKQEKKEEEKKEEGKEEDNSLTVCMTIRVTTPIQKQRLIKDWTLRAIGCGNGKQQPQRMVRQQDTAQRPCRLHTLHTHTLSHSCTHNHSLMHTLAHLHSPTLPRGQTFLAPISSLFRPLLKMCCLGSGYSLYLGSLALGSSSLPHSGTPKTH